MTKPASLAAIEKDADAIRAITAETHRAIREALNVRRRVDEVRREMSDAGSPGSVEPFVMPLLDMESHADLIISLAKHLKETAQSLRAVARPEDWK